MVEAEISLTGLEGGVTIAKDKAQDAGPVCCTRSTLTCLLICVTSICQTETPTIYFTPDILKAMAQISTMLDVKWYFGIPFLDTNADGNAGTVVSQTMSILQGNLLGFQLANEPDL